MKNRLEYRLNELKTEYESGQKMIADLEERQASLRATLLRISGAIQVLEELSSQPSEGKGMPGAGESRKVEPETVSVD